MNEAERSVSFAGKSAFESSLEQKSIIGVETSESYESWNEKTIFSIITRLGLLGTEILEIESGTQPFAIAARANCQGGSSN